jgi:hypothetical protein
MKEQHLFVIHEPRKLDGELSTVVGVGTCMLHSFIQQTSKCKEVPTKKKKHSLCPPEDHNLQGRAVSRSYLTPPESPTRSKGKLC